jgi:hypothetical protein
MNLHRNVLAIVTGALLMVSLPAGAQVLGGGLDGAANGTFGGTFGRADVGGAASAAGHAGFEVDASGATDAARGRVRQGRDMTIGAAGAARSRVESTRGTVGTSVEATHSAGVRASRRAARAAAEAQSNNSTSIDQSSAVYADTSSNGDLFVNGAGEARAEQRAMGRSVAVDGAAASQASGDRSGFASSTYGETGVAVNKPQPAPQPAPEQEPAQPESLQ